MESNMFRLVLLSLVACVAVGVEYKCTPENAYKWRYYNVGYIISPYINFAKYTGKTGTNEELKDAVKEHLKVIVEKSSLPAEKWGGVDIKFRLAEPYFATKEDIAYMVSLKDAANQADAAAQFWYGKKNEELGKRFDILIYLGEINNVEYFSSTRKLPSGWTESWAGDLQNGSPCTYGGSIQLMAADLNAPMLYRSGQKYTIEIQMAEFGHEILHSVGVSAHDESHPQCKISGGENPKYDENCVQKGMVKMLQNTFSGNFSLFCMPRQCSPMPKPTFAGTTDISGADRKVLDDYCTAAKKDGKTYKFGFPSLDYIEKNANGNFLTPSGADYLYRFWEILKSENKEWYLQKNTCKGRPCYYDMRLKPFSDKPTGFEGSVIYSDDLDGKPCGVNKVCVDSVCKPKT